MSEQETRPTVLIIDDESAIVDTLRILLKNEGFAAHVAFGGKQGLDQIAALRPDVIVSDIRPITPSRVQRSQRILLRRWFQVHSLSSE